MFNRTKKITGMAMVLAGIILHCNIHSATAVEINHTGLPLPRFVSLKSDEVNVRNGPGMRYAIRWVFRRNDLPIEIIQEFDHWREIRDHEGELGWVHKGMLSGERTGLIIKETQTLRRTPNLEASAVLKVEPGVIVKLVECTQEWCRVQADSRKGWVPKAFIWGAYTNEIFD